MHAVITYRDFEIHPSLVSYMPATDWTYSHKNYDGPEDSRIGYAGSVEEAKAQIDEWHSEKEAA